MSINDTDDSWMLKLGRTKLENKMFEEIVRYGKEQNVEVKLALCQPITTFTLNSKSFYDEDKSKMKEKFDEVLDSFFYDAAKKFIDSRISDNIKIVSISITIERGYNVLFNPDAIKNLKQRPYAHILMKVCCNDYFEELN